VDDNIVNLEQRTTERVARQFPASEQASVIELLSGYARPERERVIWDILELRSDPARARSQTDGGDCYESSDLAVNTSNPAVGPAASRGAERLI
jgi:hypothetical protein